jgi:hypothetical protein
MDFAGGDHKVAMLPVIFQVLLSCYIITVINSRTATIKMVTRDAHVASLFPSTVLT